MRPRSVGLEAQHTTTKQASRRRIASGTNFSHGLPFLTSNRVQYIPHRHPLILQLAFLPPGAVCAPARHFVAPPENPKPADGKRPLPPAEKYNNPLASNHLAAKPPVLAAPPKPPSPRRPRSQALDPIRLPAQNQFSAILFQTRQLALRPYANTSLRPFGFNSVTGTQCTELPQTQPVESTPYRQPTP